MVNPAAIAQGPALIGLFFNILLFGVMIIQTFMYFRTYRKDKGWIKVYVAILFTADALNTIFFCVWMYQCVIIHFGDTVYLLEANWEFTTGPVLTGIIAALVQSFFAWRIKVLTRSWPLVFIVVFCAMSGALGGIGTAIATTMVPEFAEFQRFKVIVIVWLVSNAVCDVIITCALTWHLRRQKTGLPATDDTINKIVRLTVQTGMITAIVAILDIGCFLGFATGLHLAFNFPLSKLYTNSLMSSLNSRSGWKYNPTSELTSREEGQGNNRSGAQAPEPPWRGNGNSGNGVIDGAVDLSTNPGSEVFGGTEIHQMVEMASKSMVSSASFYPDDEAPVSGAYGGSPSPTSPTFNTRPLRNPHPYSGVDSHSPTSPTFHTGYQRPYSGPESPMSAAFLETGPRTYSGAESPISPTFDMALLTFSFPTRPTSRFSDS